MTRGETVQVQVMLDSHGNPLMKATATKLPRVAFTEDARMNSVQTQPVQSKVTATVVGAPAGPDQEQLKEYSRLKRSLACQLRLFRDVLKKRGNELRDHQCQELMVKLAEDRFTFAVLRQFKRGKSSLINAIIRRDLLPTGVLPLTSAITVLKFVPKEQLVVEREGMLWPEVAPISQLAEYVTERGNPGNRNKKVTTANVEVPLPFLRRGLEFVDTPGVGSAITANRSKGTPAVAMLSKLA